MDTTTLLLLAAIVTAQASTAAPKELKSRIVDASVFKSGLVMVTREVTVPAGEGRYCLDVVPQADDGTFWYHSPDGLVVTDVTTSLHMTPESVKADAQTVGDYLAANVGHTIKLTYHVVIYGNPNKDVEEQVEGIVNGPPRPNLNSVPIKLPNGHLRNLALNNIEDIDTNGLKLTLSKAYDTPHLRIEFRGGAEKPSKLDFTTLETGAAWTGSYLVNLKTGTEATVVGKAQVAVGRIGFEDTAVRAMAGEPFLNGNGKYDLNAGVGSLENYLNGSQSQALSYLPGSSDPFDLLPQYSSQAEQAKQWALNFGQNGQSYDMYNYGQGGGFGGGGAGGFGGATTNSNGVARFGGGLVGGQGLVRDRSVAGQALTERLESLFAYPLGKISLEPGDRLSRILFSQASTYDDIFRWLTSVGSIDTTVKNVLRVRNTGTVPWTGGLVFVTKDDAPLAEVEMPFTSAGKTADLEMANALDLLAKKDETVISTDVIPVPGSIAAPGKQRPMIQRQLNEVHLSVESTRLEPVTFELTLTVPGEVAEPNGGKVEKLLTRPDGWNRDSRITWSFTLGPGDKREFRLQYRHVG